MSECVICVHMCICECESVCVSFDMGTLVYLATAHVHLTASYTVKPIAVPSSQFPIQSTIFVLCTHTWH